MSDDISAPGSTSTAEGSQLFVPMVRYGFDEEQGPRQEFALHHIHDPIPENMVYGSPVYLLDQSQVARYDRFADQPFATAGETNIVTELQTECEARNRVLYPVYVESDALDSEKRGASAPTVVTWLREFIKLELGMDPDVCLYYFSGGRSLHAHVPRVATNSQIEELRRRATLYNEREGAKLDPAIYSRKRQFRLPGVLHASSAVRKVRFDAQGKNVHRELAQAVNRDDTPRPTTFAEALSETCGVTPVEAVHVPPHKLSQVHVQAAEQLCGDESLLTLPTPDLGLTVAELPIQPAEGASTRAEWDRYNEKEFSPYANCGEGNPRSVAVMTVKGGAFCQFNGDTRIRLPCRVHAAIGCDGAFTVYGDDRPVQLSWADFKKRAYEPGDILVIIGGRSRQSRILGVEWGDASMIALLLKLSEEGDRRIAALDYLATEGFDVGTEGRTGAGRRPTTRSTQQSTPRKTKAAKLQTTAEKEGIDSLSHTDRFRVAMRLLKLHGFEGAWLWFSEQFGENHNPKIQYQQLKATAEKMRELGEPIEIPTRAEAVNFPTSESKKA